MRQPPLRRTCLFPTSCRLTSCAIHSRRMKQARAKLKCFVSSERFQNLGTCCCPCQVDWQGCDEKEHPPDVACSFVPYLSAMSSILNRSTLQRSLTWMNVAETAACVRHVLARSICFCAASVFVLPAHHWWHRMGDNECELWLDSENEPINFEICSTWLNSLCSVTGKVITLCGLFVSDFPGKVHSIWPHARLFQIITFWVENGKRTVAWALIRAHITIFKSIGPDRAQ